jgi:hypothetical protein
MRIHLFTVSTFIGLCVFGLNGCNKKPAAKQPGGHSHTHDEKGPNGGQVIEIGAKAHHAELVHDEASHKVGVYVLDGDAKATKAIETKSLTINVTEDEASSQFELLAVPQRGDSDGKASYFEIVSEPLSKVVSGKSDAKSVQAELRIPIGEREYVGFIEAVPHDHDYEHEDGHAG